MNIFIFIFTLLICNCYALAEEEEEIDTDELKCEICKATVNELTKELSKVDAKRKVTIGTSKLDAQGNEIMKTIPMRQSEVFISDKIDNLCKSMEDYARVRDKKTRQIKVLSLTDSAGGMNSLLSDYDFITDGDLNKSVKYYCERLIEDYEDEIIAVMKKGIKDPKHAICTQATNMCVADEEEEPYVDEAHIEL